MHNSGKALTCAGIAAGATMFMRPGETITIMGQQIPLAAFAAGGAALGSVAADMLHDQLFPLIDVSEKLRDPLSLATSAGIASAAYGGVGSIVAPGLIGPGSDQIPAMELIAVASLSELAGAAVYNNIIEPMFNTQTDVLTA